MIILFAITNLQMGGAQIVFVRLANIFSEHHKVYCYVLDNHSPNPIISLFSDSIELLGFPPNLAWIGQKLDNLMFRLKLKPVFRQWIQSLHFRFLFSRYQIDLIHTHLYHSDELVTRALRKIKIPIVLTDHGCYQYVLSKGITDLDTIKRIFNRVNHVVCISDFNTEMLR